MDGRPPPELEISPQPSADEREAITRALEHFQFGDGTPSAYASPWRQAGLEDTADPDERP